VANAPKYSVPPWKLQARPVATPAQSATASAPVAGTFPTRRSASSAGAAQQAAVACASAHRSSGESLDTAVRSRPQQASGVLPGVFGAAVRIRVDSTDPLRRGRARARADRDQCPHAERRFRCSNRRIRRSRGTPRRRRDGYQRALAREPTTADALLASRPSTLRSGQLNSAEARYLRCSRSTRGRHAVASLISLPRPA